MTQDPRGNVTDLLLAWKGGDQTALDRLVPLVYAELRRLARSYMRREKAGRTLQTTGLVNEAYLKLIRAQEVDWRNRAQFFGIAAQLMRRVLVDMARARNYRKRGGGLQAVSLVEPMLVCPGPQTDILALDEALNDLSRADERKGRIVEMRFFGGLTEQEIAAALGVSEETVRRDWRLAKSWLLRRLSNEP